MTNLSNQNKRELGKNGESKAVEYLTNQGYKILKRNFFFGKIGEIDIIAEDNGVLVFIEVKYRNSDSFGNPLETLTLKKQNTLRRVAEGYLYVNKIANKECRFDVICFEKEDKNTKITHLKNAF